VILVVGRPGLTEEGKLDRTATGVALAAVEAGARVELVGSVGDDPDGDAVALELGRAGIGHAALLRDPAGVTPRASSTAGKLPRLDAGDLDLGLRYLAEWRVLVMAEPIDDETLAVAADAAAYHTAPLIVLVANDANPQVGLDRATTVLEMPEEDAGAFGALVGRYAALLDLGRPADDAWHEALSGSGWEEAG
jgi:hypothetical protein